MKKNMNAMIPMMKAPKIVKNVPVKAPVKSVRKVKPSYDKMNMSDYMKARDTDTGDV